MNYAEWLKALGNIPRDAEFCLMDANERVTAGDKTIEFLLTEAEGYERAGRRSGRNVYRTRLYLVNPQNPENTRIEVNENYLASIDKSTISSWGFSIHTLFLENRALFEGAYQSLKEKAATVGEQSKTLLEATLSEQMLHRVTSRLQGGDANGDLRQMLDEHIRKTIIHSLISKIAGTSRGYTLTKLGIRQDEHFTWEYDREPGNHFDFDFRWKSLRYRYTGNRESVTSFNNETDSFCVRDGFLLSVNLPALGEKIASTIERASGLEA